MDLQTKLMAQIAVALDNMQAQLNYNRSLLISSIGGEPVLYDTSGSVGIDETTIPSGVLLAVGGGIAVTDSAGSVVAGLAIENGSKTLSTLAQTITTLGTEQAVYVASAVSSNGAVYSVYVVVTGSTTPSIAKLAGSATYPIFSLSGYDLQLEVSSGSAAVQWVLSKL